jgi:hypothetical protein
MGNMSNERPILRKHEIERTDTPQTINLTASYKKKYDRLANERGVQMSQHMRDVMYPEIDRVYRAEFPNEDAS